MHRLLIVDDQLVTTEELEALLTDMGYKVVGKALSGEEAVTMARELLPDMIFMDIVMHGSLDGLEAAKVINEELGIPVVFMTGYGDSSLIEKATRLNPYGYVVKPFNEAQIRSAIEIGLFKKETDEALQKEYEKLEDRFEMRTDEIRRANEELLQEIARRKEMEKRFGSLEKHLRSLMENAINFVVYRLRIDEESPFQLKVVVVSPSVTDILGPVDPMKYETWFERIHPDDRDRIINANDKAFETLRFDETARIYHPEKKEWRWIQAISTGVLDERGRPSYVNGIMIDITEQKRMERELEKTRDELEDRVDERTSALSKANEELRSEVMRRKEALEALKASQTKLRSLSSHMLKAQEKERKRISMELHDQLGQNLSLLSLRMDTMRRKLASFPEEVQEECRDISTYIKQIIEDTRRLSRELSPRIIEDLGLSAALRWLVDDSGKHMSAKTEIQMEDIDHLLPVDAQVRVYRIFQEAISNIIKHARADTIRAHAKKIGDVVSFIVKDDGNGFSPEQIAALDATEKGLGLATMEEQVKMLGGRFRVSSREGGGTEVTFSVPINSKGR
jgi:signal transduction histidine kinase/AmiR/NasT family two-component response regulator